VHAIFCKDKKLPTNVAKICIGRQQPFDTVDKSRVNYSK